MADTVEQVYVWDGNDWTPVVRDETVEKTSELTNDGEDGVNPFITAADIPAVPDKKLPIDSTDGTVVLDSPSADTFSISTGGQTRATFGAGGQLLRLQANAGFTQAVQYGLVVNPSVPAECTNSFFSFRSSPSLTTKTATLYHVCSYNRDDIGEQYGFYYGVSTSVPVKVGKVGFRANVPGADFAFYADQPSVPSAFLGDIQCNTYTTVDGAANDARIQLSTTNVSITTDGQFTVKPHLTNINQRYIPTDPASVVLKQDLDDKIQVMTQAEYDAIGLKDPKILYCITD